METCALEFQSVCSWKSNDQQACGRAQVRNIVLGHPSHTARQGRLNGYRLRCKGRRGKKERKVRNRQAPKEHLFSEPRFLSVRDECWMRACCQRGPFRWWCRWVDEFTIWAVRGLLRPCTCHRPPAMLAPSSKWSRQQGRQPEPVSRVCFPSRCLSHGRVFFAFMLGLFIKHISVLLGDAVSRQ